MVWCHGMRRWYRRHGRIPGNVGFLLSFSNMISLHKTISTHYRESRKTNRSISRMLLILHGRRCLRLCIKRSSELSFVDTDKMGYVYQNFVMHRETSVCCFHYRTVCMLSHSHSAYSKGESTIGPKVPNRRILAAACLGTSLHVIDNLTPPSASSTSCDRHFF